MPIRAKSKKQLDKMLDEVGSYELQQMQNAWRIMKTMVTDVQQKKPFIYYEDLLNVLHNFNYMDEEDKTLLIQRIEQKVWIP